ncbi:hypothetical protein [Xylanimonas ulmi]|uniref:ABC-2 type transport system permease protein n=1 Tax=Xylanimonas ulmi TaxID=228973 RepID=A0A4Q7M0W4_9MICO|nr:hypothetical protein [Xylanibacterium ulmi]RZS60543.1 hypothetical protein EV386_0806 [Xylanibacterium ulmi]
MSTTLTSTPVLGTLARREIRHYATSWLFLAGLALAAASTVQSFFTDDGTSSTMTVIVPAALLGVVGMIVMAGLVRRSDRAAAAAGAVAVPERTRTLALAAAVVVPLAAALAWFAAAMVMLAVRPPSAAAVPFGPVSTAHVVAVMAALGVVPAIGGPLLGLVVTRWLPQRGVTAIAAVAVVLVTILLQGNFEATWRWHVVWPWVYWYGPLSWGSTGTGSTSWVALPGSPFAWIVYQLALCALCVVVAMWHDAESDRSRLRPVLLATVAVAVVALVATMALGLPEAVHNPVSGLSF